MSNKESATLALAKSVGAISSRKVRKADPNQNSNGPSNPSQAFPFLIVLDFESTCWEEKKNSPPNEIIEFPAVLLDTSSGAVVDEFHTYVMPTEQPKLSPFCRELTGIAQDQVDAGVPLPTCLNLFNRWIIKVTKQHKLVMNDIKTGHNSVTFVTWSDWDLNVCLPCECKRKQIRKSSCFDAWIDLRSVYAKFYNRRPQGLNGALQDVGIKFEGRQHSGLCDARNTAALAWKLVKDGCRLPITKYVVGARIHPQFKNMHVANASNRKSPAQRNNFSALAGGAGLKTPNPIANVTAPHTLNYRPKSSSSLKRTPPMCHCGKRSKYCTVQSPGPNEGRSFYACSRGRLAKDKCVFFKWENLGESPKLREWISRSKLGRDKSVPAVGLTGKVQVMPKKTPLRDISNTPLADDFIRDNPNEHKACDKVVENKSCSLTPSPQNVPHQYFGNVQLFQPRNLTDLKKQPYLQ